MTTLSLFLSYTPEKSAMLWTSARRSTYKGASYLSLLNSATIRQHVKFKVACLVWQSLSRPAPLYLACPTALDALCGQLTFRFACCREHASVTATDLLQPLDLACGTPFRSMAAAQSRHHRRTFQTTAGQLKGHFYREAWTLRSLTFDTRRLRKTLT